MRNNKGITLIALIITIIVMLILVAVSVQIVINSGLIGVAKDAAEQTKNSYDDESHYGEELTVNVNGTEYTSINSAAGLD